MPLGGSEVNINEHGRGTGGVSVPATVNAGSVVEQDDFGLPIQKDLLASVAIMEVAGGLNASEQPAKDIELGGSNAITGTNDSIQEMARSVLDVPRAIEGEIESESDDNEDFKDAISSPNLHTPAVTPPAMEDATPIPLRHKESQNPAVSAPKTPSPPLLSAESSEDIVKTGLQQVTTTDAVKTQSISEAISGHRRGRSSTTNGISEWSHQHLAHKPQVQEEDEDEWQPMPAFAPFDMYDDDNKLIAREAQESDDEAATYDGLGGAGKGYTRLQLDEDAQSATSLDENTQYLFKEVNGTSAAGLEDEEQRDAVSQMQATKDLLTEGQRIAYVGMTRLTLSTMLEQVESVENKTRAKKKETSLATEEMKMWSQKMMVRLYTHMEISTAEQIMIEQLAEHGVQPSDLTPALMQNARVKNPMAEGDASTELLASPRQGSVRSSRNSISSPRSPEEEEVATAPPPYVEHEGNDLPEVRTPAQLPTSKNIDIDLRWTVLCDLFLTLVADSVYDARSRVLLERVGEHMNVSWLDICRFEKRVTDALEMQQAAEKENWNEDEHKENRRKLALKRRYVMMGLATVGGGLVIGLSAGLLAPVIGAGLAAGFTTIGVAGTSGFLAGAGGAAIITSSATLSGGIIAVKAAGRRTSAVKTFEYRPLHNKKRVNLIVTVSGWMTGKVDDIRLPFSTIDPIMGDIYSVLWEPEMLTSMGDTINILATEALTQGLQQLLGSTILVSLMAALQLPVVLTKLAYLIDNPWTVSLDRANMAGLILADSLIDRNLGTRPITFVGYSLGSRVIFSCLRELARKGAYGLVQNVYLFGSPIVAKKDEYLKARSVVAGRFVNGYATADWILAYLFRLTSGGISRVAGLAPIEGIPRLENVNVTEFVAGHMSYRKAMPRLLREVGWVVESDEFTEIEDPDPENHQKRQRELINEIEEARREAEKKQKEEESKGTFGFFSRKKKAIVQRKEWETYQESKEEVGGKKTEDGQGNNHGVLFDVDAIRAELASEHMEVRELKSTLPPMKLDLDSAVASPVSPRTFMRGSEGYDTGFTLASRSPGIPSPLPPTRSPSNTRISNDFSPRRTGSSPYLHLDDEIHMSFDTSYQSPIHSSTSLTSNLYSNPRSKSPISSPPIAPTDHTATQQRPELKIPDALPAFSSNPLPPLSSNFLTPLGSSTLPSLDHNAWADDDDEFHEKEMEMTFA